MTRKRIVLFTSSLRAGGAERVVATLSRSLAREYDVRILLLARDIAYELDQNIPVDILGSGSTADGFRGIVRIPFLARDLLSYCRDIHPDAIVSFLSRPNFVAALARKRGMEAKVLVSERVYTPSWYRDDELRGRIGKWLTQKLYPFADAIIPNSKGTAKALEQIYGIENCYFVVKNPIALGRIEALAAEPVEDVEFGEFTFVCVARFLEQKNHRLLIEAFSLLQGSSRLLLIGKGPLLDESRKQVAASGLGGRVSFLESTGNPFKYLARSDCFVLSSDFEGFPNVLLEALACGLPVISTDCPTGPRELLADEGTVARAGVEVGKYGVLVPTGNAPVLAKAMEMLLRDGALRNRLSTAGRERAADFEEEAVAREFFQIIEKVTTSNGMVEDSAEINETRNRQ